MFEEIQGEMEKFEEYKEQIINKAKASTERLIEKRTKELEIALDRKSKSANQLIENEKSKIPFIKCTFSFISQIYLQA